MSRIFSNMISLTGSVCKPLSTLVFFTIMQIYKKCLIPANILDGAREKTANVREITDFVYVCKYGTSNISAPYKMPLTSRHENKSRTTYDRRNGNI